MTLDEAIRLKKEYRDNRYIPLGSKIAEADNLSIEALERIQVGRNNPGTKWNDPLPEETKD